MDGKKIYFITGADRGLGFSLCKLLLRSGNRVYAGRYMEQWKQLEELKESFGDDLMLIPLDVSESEAVKKAVKMVSCSTDYIDVLINCAGISGQIKDIREGFDYARMQKVLNTNALGPIRVIECFLPLLQNGEKRIWNLSSEAGSIGSCWRKDEVEYCMSKAALNMGIHILHNLLNDEGFELRLYHPGWMNTYMTGKKETEADLDPDTAAGLLLTCLGNRRNSDKIVLESYDGKKWEW